MSLGKGRINALNVIGQRRLLYIPKHFNVLKIISSTDISIIDKWIYQNLNSRYCIISTQGLDNQNKIIDLYEIGMEDNKELTMLSLACPYLHNK